MANRKDSITLTAAEISDLGTAAKKDVGAAKGQIITVGDTLGIGDPVDIPVDQFVSVRVEMPVDSIWNQRRKAAEEALESAEYENQQDVQQ